MTLDLIPFIFIFSSYSSSSLSGFISQNTITCAHIILRFWPVCHQFLLLNVHTWINVCSSCSFCDSWGSYIVCFLNENMVKPVQNDAVIVKSFAENIDQIGKCVKTGEMC